MHVIKQWWLQSNRRKLLMWQKIVPRIHISLCFRPLKNGLSHHDKNDKCEKAWEGREEKWTKERGVNLKETVHGENWETVAKEHFIKKKADWILGIAHHLDVESAGKRYQKSNFRWSINKSCGNSGSDYKRTANWLRIPVLFKDQLGLPNRLPYMKLF